MYDIFISYRTTHSSWVETLAHNLMTQGYEVFLDRWELKPGEDFPAKIHAALKSARCAILVATPDTCDSGWVQQELQLMIDLKNTGSGFFFIPVIMGEFPDLPFIETVQAVDFGDSSPEIYRQAFQRLLCGIDQEPPGPNPFFSGELKIPDRRSDADRPLVERELTFLDRVFDKLSAGLPLMILAQADTNTQVYARALRKHAETLYGADNVLHIFPPISTRADCGAYFGRLARQCHLDDSATESWQWAEALAERLEGGREIFLLVSGFENGPDESRAELAGELRQLNEAYRSLRIVMMGSKRLAALKYAHGSMSLLNIAEEMPIPEPAPHGLTQIFGHIYPRLALTDDQLQAVIAFTGGHPRLLHHCLQHNANTAETCERLLRDSPLPAQLFKHFRTDKDPLALCGLLSQERLGPYDPWPAYKLLRRLYWSNLIVLRGRDFYWRCGFIQQVGREMLECA